MRPLRFSRRTVVAAVAALGSLNVAQLVFFLLELGPEFPQTVGGNAMGISNPKRLNGLISMVDEDPDRVLDDGELLVDSIVAKAASLIPLLKAEYPWQSRPTLSAEQTKFLRLLSLDGFTVSDGTLRAALPADLGVPAAEDETTQLLTKYGFTVPAGHLRQALDVLGQGRWAAANAQLRTFFESLLDEVALVLDPAASAVKSGHPRRTKLAAVGFLYKELNEWDDNGKGFINGLMLRLHPEGSHPGLSDESDAIYRMQIVLTTARLLLSRLDAGMQS